MINMDLFVHHRNIIYQRNLPIVYLRLWSILSDKNAKHWYNIDNKIIREIQFEYLSAHMKMLALNKIAKVLNDHIQYTHIDSSCMYLYIFVNLHFGIKRMY